MSSSPKKKKKEGASKEIALVKEKKATDVYSDSSEDDAKWDLDEENEPLVWYAAYHSRFSSFF